MNILIDTPKPTTESTGGRNYLSPPNRLNKLEPKPPFCINRNIFKPKHLPPMVRGGGKLKIYRPDKNLPSEFFYLHILFAPPDVNSMEEPLT